MRLTFLLLLTLVFTACRTPRQLEADRRAQERAMQQQQELARQRRQAEERQRTQLLVEDTELQLNDLRQELNQLSANVTVKANNRDLQQLEQRLAGLERQLQQLEAQRAKDRQEIIDTLSQRMATLMAQQTRTAPSGRTHTVARGDTLSAIASAYRVSTRELMRVNNISNPDALRIGTKLVIPGGN